jgi:ATP phosphoribosyltransferase regulatory subunit
MNQWLKEKKEIFKQKEDMNYFLTQRGYQWVDPAYLMAYNLEEKYLRSEALVKVLDSQGQVKILRPECTYNLMDEIKDTWSKEVLRLQYDGVVFERRDTGIKALRQIGGELIGEEEEKGDLEILEIIMNLSEKISGMVVVSHSGFLKGLLSRVKLSTEDEKILIDGLHHKNERLLRTLPLSENMLEACLKIVDLEGYDLDELSKYFQQKDMTQAFNRLKKINEKFGDKVSIDLALTTKFDYYSGMLCQVFVKECNDPIILGGRYDGLMEGMKEEMTAVGFAVDFENYIRMVKK